jgi:very-short-patch-repair endonuclease
VTEEALAGVARRQYALFTVVQAMEVGLSRRQVEAGERLGRWERLYRGVYRMGGAPVGDEQRLLAAVLAVGLDAVASHRAAAWVWRLVDDLRIEVTAPRRSRVPGVTTHVRPTGCRAVVRRGIPCTDPLRTVLDLAATGDEVLVAGALDRGIADGLFTAAAVRAALERTAGKGVRGAGVLRRVLARRLDADGERVSALESAMDRLVVRFGVPRPVRQHPVGGTPYRLDYAWPDRLLAVEVDGYGPHSSREAFQSDRARQNALVLAGWTVLRFTWADVRDRPAAVAAVLRRALGASRPA